MKRFKWAYFDFIVWLTYIPFLYFAMVQMKNLIFSSATDSLSNVISLIILLTYPFYGLLIVYQLRKNYELIKK